MIGTPTLWLLVGLPASGKTTKARELEARERAVRFSPDEWMIPLYGDSEASGKRDVLEGRLITTALRLVELGVPVILDFGLWGRDERFALRWLAGAVGGTAEIIYLPIEQTDQWERVRSRYAGTPEQTFHLTAADLERYRAIFEPPDDAEIDQGPIPEAPPPFADWRTWAERRWPSLTAPGG